MVCAILIIINLTLITRSKIQIKIDSKVKTILPYVLRQIKTWSKAYKATETETIVAMDHLINNLTELLPSYAESHTCLVDGDYRLDNVIFDI